MSIKVVLFDLDGTLLPMDQKEFVKTYFGLLARRLAPLGYDPDALIKSVWLGTEAMVANDGAKTNEEVFWDRFCQLHGEQARADEPQFRAFYIEEFDKVQTSCGYNPEAARTVAAIRDMGFRVSLATNPIFPAIATEKRCRWAGLEASDFELYTTYENARFCKPNLAYYESILTRLGVSAEECLMVGNDVGEDMIAEELGMKVFLLDDCVINKENRDLSAYPHGSFGELLAFVSELR